MTQPADFQSFLRSYQGYSKKLAVCKDFDEILALWRSTTLPYESCAHDPFSPEYRKWVLEVYRTLTGDEYNHLNEMTSTKLGKDEFKIGYPFISRNLSVVAGTYGQLTQAFSHIRERPPASIIEFGSGWGLLSMILARTGYVVTSLDIDDGFLKRLGDEAAATGISLSLVQSEFIDFTSKKRGPFDVAIFHQSFHHCDDPLNMLIGVRENVLAQNGSVYFFGEPISKELSFPWGLRYDGESLWAIGCNKWFELGFQQDFFVELLLRAGYCCRSLAGIAGYVGNAYAATPAVNRVGFGEVLLPEPFDMTWHPAEQYGDSKMRFSHSESRLPSLKECSVGGTYELTLHNFGSLPLKISVRTQTVHSVTLAPQSHLDLTVDASKGDVIIESSTFIPAQTERNGDDRVLGVALTHIKTSAS